MTVPSMTTGAGGPCAFLLDFVEATGVIQRQFDRTATGRAIRSFLQGDNPGTEAELDYAWSASPLHHAISLMPNIPNHSIHDFLPDGQRAVKLPNMKAELIEGSVPVRLREAALELFAARGLAPVTIREIAERAHITSAVLYHYYESKEHLYEALLTDLLDRLQSTLTMANDPGLSPRERIIEISRAFLTNFADQKRGGAFVLRELLGMGAQRFKDVVEQRDRQTRSYLRHALLEGMESGEFRRVDSTMCSMAITAMLNSFARRSALGAKFSLDDALSQISEVYLRGLERRPNEAGTTDP